MSILNDKTGMMTKLQYLLASMLLLHTGFAPASDYIPPPTGPYQSTIVINEVEQNSTHKHQVYKFPQAELFQSRDPDFELPRSEPIEEERLPILPAENDQFNSYRIPDSIILPPSMGPQSSPMVIQQQNPRANLTTPQRWYDPTLYNNPWGQNPAPQQQPYQGEWNYPDRNYNYYPSPKMFRNQNNMMNAPFSMMPTPWAMQPGQTYDGR